MTNIYNTGNPLGSTDPRDLLDNASNLDDAMNSASPTFPDRFLVQRDTWAGQQNKFNLAQSGREAEFQQFLADSGFVSLGNYAAGLNFTAYNQYMARDGFFYRPAPSSIPFTTTGTWVGGDEDLFNLFSADDVLRQDLADDTDTAKGSKLVGHAGRTVYDALNGVIDIAALRMLVGAFDGQVVDVNSYSTLNPRIGGGKFMWDASSTSVDDGGLVIQATGVPTGRWLRVYTGRSVDPTWFGAVDGVDSSAAILACHATGRNVSYPAGKWLHSVDGGIPLTEGQQIYGVGGHRFGTPAQALTWLECTATDSPYAFYESTGGAGQVGGVGLYDCYVLSDHGLRIGSISTLVGSQGLSMKPIIMRNIFQARTVAGGRGLTMVGCFDFEVANNEFRQFDIPIALVGCDIGDVHNNRTTFHGSFAILELSAAPNFGSQNKIRNNDILVGSLTSSVFIRSTSQHPRIYDNYLEQGQGQNAITGFIDTSLQSPPTLGVNTGSGIQQSVVVENNRIDGHNKCTSFLYKINPGAVTTKLRDSGATGTQDGTSAPWLTLADGEVGLKVRFNTFNFCNWDISGGTGRFTQDFPQFKTTYPGASNGVFEITPESLASLDHAGLAASNGADFLRLSPKSFAILPAAGTTWIHLLPEQANDVVNDLFATGVSFTVTVVARCTIAGENILTGRSTGSGAPAGDVSSAMALTTQYKTFTATLTGQAAGSVTGLAVRRDNLNAGIVHIKSITVKAV